MDILPYSPDTISAVLKDAEQTLITTDTRRLLLNVDDATDWCIFCVEVRNTYGLPFEVSFERVQSGKCYGVSSSVCSHHLHSCGSHDYY